MWHHHSFFSLGSTNNRLRRSTFIVLVVSLLFSLSSGSLQFLTDISFATDETPSSFVENLVEESQVIVFSKSYCPYCARTKALFQKLTEEEPFLGIVVKVLELDQTGHGSLIQQALMERTNQRTVPNVFVGGNHVGGNDDTHALAASGQLQEMLASIDSSEEL